MSKQPKACCQCWPSRPDPPAVEPQIAESSVSTSGCLQPSPATMFQIINWQKNPLSPDYRGAGSFATFMIIGCKWFPMTCPTVSSLPLTTTAATCFFLGILFASFPYDFPLLWSADPVPDEYYDILETHLRWLHQSPPLIGRVLNIITSVGFLGFALKLYRPAELNFLFDGASLILYSIGWAIYLRRIVPHLRVVSGAAAEEAGLWLDEVLVSATAAAQAAVAAGGGNGQGESELDVAMLTRKGNVKMLSMSNTILALVLLGVLVLQVGQWYAEALELQDLRLSEMQSPARRGSGLRKKQ
jgi:hypothetical protein